MHISAAALRRHDPRHSRPPIQPIKGDTIHLFNVDTYEMFNAAANAAGSRCVGGVSGGRTTQPKVSQSLSSTIIERARYRFHPGRRIAVAVFATATAHHTTTPRRLALHVGDTTINAPINADQAATIAAGVAGLLQTFAAKAAATRPRRWEPLELRFTQTDDAANGLELLEVFCNPNSAATAFDAKLLLTLRGAKGGLSVTAEQRLSAFKADLDAFIAAMEEE